MAGAFSSCEQPLSDAWRSAPLAAAFLRGEPALNEFYPYPPAPDGARRAWPDRQAQVFVAPRADLVAALAATIEPLNPTAAQRASLDRLAAPETAVVVTGQQPGLFGGPLLTLHKALTAVVEAARRTAAGWPTVPVFWVATEDDDWAEVATTVSLNAEHELQRLRLDFEPAPNHCVGPVALDPAVMDRLWARLASALPAGDAALALPEQLRVWTAGAMTLGDHFKQLMQALLGPLGLLFVDPLQSELRRLCLPFAHRLLADPLGPTRLAGRAAARLEALGHRATSHRPPDLCAFYLVQDNHRHRLTFDGESFSTDNGERLYRDDLAARLEADPGALSYSMLLRPVVQDFLLPTASLVVGPGEISYCAQVAPIYGHLGVARPHLLARRSLTLVPPRPARTLDRYGLRPCDFEAPLDQLLAQVVRAESGTSSARAVAAAQDAVAAALAPLVEHAGEVDPTLTAAAQRVGTRLAVDLDRLGTKLQRAHRRQAGTDRRRLAAAQAWLAPGGRPQERVLGLLPFLALSGPALVERVQAAVEATPWDVHGVLGLFDE